MGLCLCGSSGTCVDHWGPDGAMSPGTVRAVRRTGHRAAGAGRAGTRQGQAGCPRARQVRGQGQLGSRSEAAGRCMLGPSATGSHAIGGSHLLFLQTMCVVPADSGVWGRGPRSAPSQYPPLAPAFPMFPLNLLPGDSAPTGEAVLLLLRAGRGRPLPSRLRVAGSDVACGFVAIRPAVLSITVGRALCVCACACTLASGRQRCVSLNNMCAPLCPACVPWLAILDRVYLRGVCTPVCPGL